MPHRIEHINPYILKECRDQISLSLQDIQKKIPKIEQIERGEIKPTLNQLSKLSTLYGVPRWVFIKEKLPEKYNFENTVPGFRLIKDSPLSNDPHTNSKLKQVMAKVEGLRELIIELDSDMGKNISPFHCPDIELNDPEKDASDIRRWCAVKDGAMLCFSEWKELLEKKGIFIFMTSKYRGWSHLDRTLFRGLAIYHDTLPIIIINDSDAQKAQSFTLFHELGHLLQGKSSIDSWDSHNKEEQWCNHFAGAVLMPEISMPEAVLDFLSLKRMAERFQVSPYALLVRQKVLGIIDQERYQFLKREIDKEWANIQQKLKDSNGGPARDRVKEILNQYGYYSRIFFQAYQEDEINLHRLMTLLEFKKISYVREAQEGL